MKNLIDQLHNKQTLSAEEYKALLLCQDADTLKYLQEQAREVSLEQFSNRVFIRGLIEITNHCRNNCYYCGIRKGNQSVLRYELTREDILECCREGYTLGFRTFVLQGGETSSVKDDFILETVTAIHREFPDCAITLSLGEKSRETYEHFFRRVPIDICFATKRIMKSITIICTPIRCLSDNACNVWHG